MHNVLKGFVIYNDKCRSRRLTLLHNKTLVTRGRSTLREFCCSSIAILWLQHFRGRPYNVLIGVAVYNGKCRHGCRPYRLGKQRRLDTRWCPLHAALLRAGGLILILKKSPQGFSSKSISRVLYLTVICLDC